MTTTRGVSPANWGFLLYWRSDWVLVAKWGLWGFGGFRVFGKWGLNVVEKGGVELLRFKEGLGVVGNGLWRESIVAVLV